MSRAAAFNLKEIFPCCACRDDERNFAEGRFKPAANGYYKKHPPIGHGRELFFISINPRITNNAPMEWAMASAENFSEFAANRYQRGAYIPAYGEAFYDIHFRICTAVFPGQPIEDVAIIHELYLCATPNAKGLPRSLSPCAERYLWPHLVEVNPKLVIAFGRSPAEFLCCPYGGDRVLNLPEAPTRVISLPFPKRYWSDEFGAAMSDWVRRCFAVEASQPLPGRDFGRSVELYSLSPRTADVDARLNRLPPQAKACIEIMQLGGKREYTQTELRELMEQHSTASWTVEVDRPLRTRQRPWRIFKYYRRKLLDAGAIEKRYRR